MPETPRGITYPASDAHTRLWEHFQTLADTVDDAVDAAIAASALPDSGWVGCAYASGWRTSGTSSPLAVRKIGKVVYLRGTVTNTAGSIPVAPSGGHTIGTIPGGYTPPTYSEAFAVASQNPGAVPARLFANSSGSILLYTYGAAVPYVSISVSYVVA